MKSVKDATGTPYDAPKHFNVYGLQKFVEESERINKNTKDSQILSRVKDVFSRNHEAYLQRYVKPVLIERLLQNKFFFDTLYQKDPWKKINEAYNGVTRKSNASVKVFSPKKTSSLSYYKQFINKGISEDKYNYFFIKENKDDIEVYITRKHDFTKWFRKKDDEGCSDPWMSSERMSFPMSLVPKIWFRLGFS